jgi:hypothetical protein
LPAWHTGCNDAQADDQISTPWPQEDSAMLQMFARLAIAVVVEGPDNPDVFHGNGSPSMSGH